MNSTNAGMAWKIMQVRYQLEGVECSSSCFGWRPPQSSVNTRAHFNFDVFKYVAAQNLVRFSEEKRSWSFKYLVLVEIASDPTQYVPEYTFVKKITILSLTCALFKTVFFSVQLRGTEYFVLGRNTVNPNL